MMMMMMITYLATKRPKATALPSRYVVSLLVFGNTVVGVDDSVAPCVGCKEASFDSTVVALGVIGGVADSAVSMGST